MDNLTREQRRKAMKHIRSKDTSIEVVLRKSYGKKGIVTGKTLIIYRVSRILH